MNYDERVAWIRARLRKIIARRLREITGGAAAQMHYKTYWLHIVQKHLVLVDRWPVELIPFCDPSRASGSLAVLELLWIRWKRRATGFRHATAAEMAAFEAAGLFDRPARKRRSDYDVVRGRRRDPATRSKKLRMKVVKTPAVVPDGADDSD
ncbi:hypothetical protein K466DRAFT_605968 [Polyporus arcularius HHB13444]|uniref:Uncharacterized protein n=1 Tax=Polyporus arcularius HHB13444 TaxID=1314778 RepID=A0A5C3NQR2_9APHY|nr:hypothetical protein K466DRAFT_605968 [Polyporus arcularius HHB13444]